MMVSELKKAVALLKRAAADGKTRPILGGILINATGMESTDLDVAFSATMETGIEEPIVVDAKRLSQVIRPLKAKDEVTLERGESTLIVRHAGGSVKLPMLAEADEFPRTDTVDESSMGFKGLMFPSYALQAALKRVCVASAKDSTRYQLHSVLFVMKDGTLSMIATDGKRLVRETLPAGGDDFEAIVPLPAVELMVRMPFIASLQFDDANVRATSANGYGRTSSSEGFTVEARTVEGIFPDWKRAFPDECWNRFGMNIVELLGAVETAKIATTKETNSVAFEVKDGVMTVSAESTLNGEASATLPAACATGATIKANFNPDYVVDLCKSLKGEDTITLAMKDHKNAGLFIVDDFSCVIMPLVTHD